MYALLIYGDDSSWVDLPDDERARLRALELPEWHSLFDELARADPTYAGKELDGRRTAKVVTVRDGERVVTDGPYAEVKEALGGYYLFECASIEDALHWAARVPGAEHGSIEVRPVYSDPTDPEVGP